MVTQAAVQPSANPTRTRPWLSIVASMKSSRLRSLPHVVPPVQIEPRWTGSVPVALEVFQVLPPSYVEAM